ncbi:mitochondrial carrier, partial [Basidiobolus meristosporus CBS 931.73]
VKVRLQTQTKSHALYRGTAHCFSSIVRYEGVRGLFKGMASPMAGVALVNALAFGVYESALNFQMQGSDGDATYKQMFIAGIVTGTVNSFVSCPMELAKIRLQNQGPEQLKSRNYYKGPMDCFLKTYRAGGVVACYRGLWPTILREFSFGPYFVSYEILCRMLTPAGKSTDDLGSLGLIVAGGFAGICAWVSTYPFDVVKTKIQADVTNNATPRYRGVVDCIIKCYREEGISVLFRGMNATILRAFPLNATTFFVYTQSMRLLNNGQES